MTLRRLADICLFLLAAAAPLGTRYIFRAGSLNGAPVEWGTASLFGTQILALVFVILAILAVGAERAEAARKEAALRPVLVLLAAALLSSFGAVDSAYALQFVGWIALGAAVLHAVILLRPSRTVVLSGFVAGGIFQATLALAQFLTQTVMASKWFGIAAHSAATAGDFVVETASGRWLRAYGTFGHPNALGFYLALAVAAAFFLWLAARGPLQKRIVLNIILLCTAGLFVAFSRSALVALATALVVLFWVRRKEPRRFAAPTLVLLACLAVCSALFFEPAWTRLSSEGRLEQRSNAERISSAADAVALFKLHPLLGVGAGNMPAAVRAELDADRLGWDYQPVHTVPLLVAAETGLIGLLAWLALVVIALRTAFHRARGNAEANAVEARDWRQTPLRHVIGDDDVEETKVSGSKRKSYSNIFKWFPIYFRLLPSTFNATSTSLPQHRCLNALPQRFAPGSFIIALLVFSLLDHFFWSVWPGQLIFWLILAICIERPAD